MKILNSLLENFIETILNLEILKEEHFTRNILKTVLWYGKF